MSIKLDFAVRIYHCFIPFYIYFCQLLKKLYSLNYFISTRHQLLFFIFIITYQTILSNFSHFFIDIVLIPKLKEKSNCEEWHNAMQGFYKIN